MSQELDTHISEWLKWYEEHVHYFKREDFIKNPDAMADFFRTTARGMMLGLAIVARDIRNLENSKSNIILPPSMYP